METFHPSEEIKETINDSAIPDGEGITEKWLREKLIISYLLYKKNGLL